MSSLAERLIAVHDALDAARLPHAFGGAIALAYCVDEPRGTRDVDVNVFVGIERCDEVLDAMPSEVNISTEDRVGAKRDGQVRVFFEDTPIDIFLDTDEFHREVASGIKQVPFEGGVIPVIGCSALIVFKVMFNRTRDWGDIESILDAGTAGPREALSHLRSILGAEDQAVMRLERLAKDR